MARIIATTILLGALLTSGLLRNSSAGEKKVAAGPAIDFNRDIRPILSDNCFTCHGPDESQRKAKLRLDTRDGALTKLRSGGHAIVPGKSSDSELLRRLISTDNAERMPPPKTNKKLTPAQVDLVKRWIEQDANYAKHWAFVAPVRASLPEVKDSTWARNGIDRFILARLEKEGLKPSPEADRTTLIRRLALDLTGLPPTVTEIDTFLNDKLPGAYERVVERYLSSPHYGERMAVDWLDAARFADTHGYHIDAGRDMTRWREWVIDAFNNDLPFDRFTVEQLAGDLLPNATVEQKIASGFNRNHMINFEGGASPEEYLNNYIVDRVNTTATVWLGLTTTCAQCHDHKYDPISQREFYQLYAFFNGIPEKGLDGSKGNAAPTIKVPTKAQRDAIAKLDAQIQPLESTQKDPKKLAELLAEKKKLEAQGSASAMVMQDMPTPRDTFMLLRGEYNKKGAKVSAGVPTFLPPLAKDAPANRLTFARWLTDPAHPLMSRVIVNRYWQLFLGTGLVKTVEDFGSQGEQASHAELLDWLAVEFATPTPGGVLPKRPWSVRDLVRTIVTSATYRQASVVTKEHLARDTENRLLARGPRFRLQAEFIRDQALAISGLLNREIGGASVSPYQPAGLWQELASRQDSKNWSAQFFVQSKGKDLYRRTMYTFWKRTSPPPQLMTFDAPDREICTVRRSRTNTPLQALVLMNDPTYVEASRKFAERMMQKEKTPETRLAFAWRTATARTPSDREIGILQRALDKQLQIYRGNLKAAEALLRVGDSPRDETLAAPELAAYTIIASVILNLDEVVTKN
ncbi:MAG: DUF1553 domain-containing protein [Gemmataceae bacterium]|nr:DUF1553 domain-containing protein [Gemmataceae bacterium]